MPLRSLATEKVAVDVIYFKFLIMQQYNADWYCSQCPFWVLSTQFDNNDFPTPSRPEVLEVIEEALDIDSTIEGDMDIDYIKFRIKLNDISWVSTGLWLWKVRYFKLHKKIYNMTFIINKFWQGARALTIMPIDTKRSPKNWKEIALREFWPKKSPNCQMGD